MDKSERNNAAGPKRLSKRVARKPAVSKEDTENNVQNVADPKTNKKGMNQENVTQVSNARPPKVKFNDSMISIT